MSSPPRCFSFFGLPLLLSSLIPILFQILEGQSVPFTGESEGGGGGRFLQFCMLSPSSSCCFPPLSPCIPFSVSVPLNFLPGKNTVQWGIAFVIYVHCINTQKGFGGHL